MKEIKFDNELVGKLDKLKDTFFDATFNTLKSLSPTYNAMNSGIKKINQ